MSAPRQVRAGVRGDEGLAAAAGGSADVIVTGDRDLLDLNGHRDIEILDPRSSILEGSLNGSAKQRPD